MSDWRSRLTADEVEEISALEARLFNAREDIRKASIKRRTIYMRAKKRQERAQIVVDSVTANH